MKYSFYHITDTHYYSKKNYDSDPWTLPQWNDQIAMRESEEIVKQALKMVNDDKDADTILFTGDMTHHGDVESSTELIALLDGFQSKGNNVIAFIDSHDYFENGIRFDKNGKPYPKKRVFREDALPLYSKYNIDKAISVYKDNFSCVIELAKGVRYIILSYEHLGNGPQLTDEYMQWIKEQCDDAKQNGCLIIGGIHPPFLSPSPMYDLLGKGNVVFDNDIRSKQLADMGLQIVLSGHSHIQSIQYKISDKGVPFYDIATSSLVGSPPKMRKITVDTLSMTVNVKTINMDVPSLGLDVSLTGYCKRGFLGSLESIPYNMEHNVDCFIETGGGVELPKNILKKNKKLIKFAGKKLNNLTFGKLAKHCKHITKLKKDEYSDIANDKVVPYIFDIVANIYSGNANIQPASAKYKITMGTVAIIDSILSVLPIKLEKLIGFNNVKTIIEPLVYNNSIDNDNALLDLNNAPTEAKPLPSYKSYKGIGLLILVVAILIIFLPLWIVCAVVFIVIKTINKSIKKVNKSDV